MPVGAARDTDGEIEVGEKDDLVGLVMREGDKVPGQPARVGRWADQGGAGATARMATANDSHLALASGYERPPRLK